MRILFPFIFLLILTGNLFAQIEQPVTWEYSVHEGSDSKFVLHIQALIAADWYIYAENMPDGGPLPMVIGFDETTEAIQGEPLRADKFAKSMYDDVFEMQVNYYDDTAAFVREFVPMGNKFEALLYTEAQACYKKDGQCILLVFETLLQFEKVDGHWQIISVKTLKQ